MKTSTKKYGFAVSCTEAENIMIQKESEGANQQITAFDFYFSKSGETSALWDDMRKDPDREKNSRIEIEFSFPARNIVGMWHPSCGTDRTIRADWCDGIETMLSRSAPVICFFDNNSRNVRTYALSEVKQKVISFYGIHEEDGWIRCRIVIDYHRAYDENHYRLKVWESAEQEAYWETLRKTEMFWESTMREQVMSVPMMNVPEAARMPLYSFWYSMHQNVDAERIEKESLLAAKMGFSTIIVDDGWQTDDNHRGYAYCGDWEPSENKFPDFPAHVKKVQSFGIRYMIWFSVPFVGRKAKCFSKFQDKLLTFDENSQAGVLDIRYPEVREYLVETYTKAVRDWGVDGLKLDFIDEFYLREDSPEFNIQMDFSDVQQALSRLLTDIRQTLRSLKPDILIEFRQKYIGPEVRKYGNMLRVVDCPGSAISNRIGIADIRLLAGDTAVHSDMLMWHPEESPENVALQLVSCLFGTVQISVLLEELTDEKRNVLTFWLEFMKKHRTLLQESTFEPLQPQNLYPFVHACSKNTGEEILVSYAENHFLSLEEMNQPEFYYINAGATGKVVLEGHSQKNIAYQVFDCTGKETASGIIPPNMFHRIHMGNASMFYGKMM